MAILSPLTNAASTVYNTITAQTWGPLVSVCRNGTLSQLTQGIKLGKLVLFEGGSTKTSTVFGSDKEGLPIAFLDVHDEKFWVRLALFADMVRVLRENLLQGKSLTEAGFRGKLHAGRIHDARFDQIL